MKRIKENILLLILICVTSLSVAQNFTISGYVKDDATGESTIGATVYIKELTKGAATNLYGFYSITVPKGNYTLEISYVGFETISQPIVLDKNLNFNYSLKPKAYLTKEVEITGEKSNNNTDAAVMGKMKLDMVQIRKLPAFLGEIDLLKTIQLLPGVTASGDGNTGFYVRGGGPDQNLILLDEAVVYNASHLLGFFSVFNGDAVKNIELTKGGMPANFGGRLSSVLEVNMKEGNSKKFKVEGGIGLISSRLTFQGPIIKEKCSFIVSARRTYFSELSHPFFVNVKKLQKFQGNSYYFYDFNTKINYTISDKDRVFLSGYFGKDVFTYKSKEDDFKVDVPWGNTTASGRWNHIFNSKVFLTTAAYFTNYNFQFNVYQDNFELKLFSGIRDYSAKTDLTWFPNIRNQLKFGGIYTFHQFTPNNVSAKQGETVFDLGKLKKLYANDAAIYINDEYDLREWFKINAGLRYSYFQQVGPFDRYVKDNIGNTVDTITYTKNENIKTYGGFEPRLTMRFVLNSKSSLKFSYTKNYQYIHLVSLSSVSLPTDIWMPSTSLIKPQIGRQVAGGYFRNFHNDMFETSVETYYKTMDNQVEYKEGSLPDAEIKDNLDNQLTQGSGKSYGVEFFLKKRTGKWTGWIGYTISKTTRTFIDLNKGQTFLAKYDRRHDISVSQTYDLNEHWSFGLIFIYATGNKATLPVARYFIEGQIVNEYGARNSFIMPAYHRLDVCATYTPKKKKRYEQNWNFSVFNVYNHLNPYFIYFDNGGNVADGSFKVNAKMVSVGPILPSIAWNFNF